METMGKLLGVLTPEVPLSILLIIGVQVAPLIIV